MPAESHPLRPPGVSGEASQLPWQCQARELERLASEQSATTRITSQPQRSTACLRRRHLHSRCEPTVRHRLEAKTATHSQISIVDLLEHKSLSIIHELRPLVNKPSAVAQVSARPSSRLSRLFGRPSLHHPSRRMSLWPALQRTGCDPCRGRQSPSATLPTATLASTAPRRKGTGGPHRESLAVGLARESRNCPQLGELPVRKRGPLGWQNRQARLAALHGIC